ncbi:MAG: hypothetical protein R2726_13090 [Acidimicrobiales bacterium]
MLAWGGSSMAAARRAGRHGLGFFAQGTVPGLQEAYEAAVVQAGHQPGLCLLDPSTPLSVFVNDDLRRGLATRAPTSLADATSYADWNAGLASAATTASLSTARTVEDLRHARLPSRHRAKRPWRWCAPTACWGCSRCGLDPELAWTYLRWVVDEVLPGSQHPAGARDGGRHPGRADHRRAFHRV